MADLQADLYSLLILYSTQIHLRGREEYKNPHSRAAEEIPGGFIFILAL